MVKSEAWNWAAIADPRWQEPAEEVDHLVERWGRAGKVHLLDLGCGVGRHALFFAARGFEVDAFDLSPSGLAAAEEAAAARGLAVRMRS